MKKEKLLVYPYNIETAPIVRHMNLLDGLNIKKLVMLEKYNCIFNDANIVDKGSVMGIDVSFDFENALEECDTVFISDISDSYNTNLIKKRMFQSIKCGKNIICSISIENNELDKAKELCKSKGVYFKYYYTESNQKVIDFNSQNTLIHSIETPVIFITGLYENTNKFELQLSVRENFISKGYKVSQVGTRNYCEFLGFHSFPQFMFSKKYFEDEKIILFNHYVKNIEISEKPDIIIIGVPGGLMPINNKLLNKFGITAFEVSNAIIPDYVVMSTNFFDFEADFFEKFSTTIEHKFGYPIDCYNISNLFIDSTIDMKNSEKLLINLEIVNETLKKYNSSKYHICNIYNKNENNNIVDDVIEKLSKNEDNTTFSNGEDVIINIDEKLNKIFIDRFNLDLLSMQKNILDSEFLGENFRFVARHLLYLYFDVVEVFNINIPESFILEGKFNTYNNVLNIIKTELGLEKTI